ncbi:MAG: ATP-dependent RNA helicase HrpA [Candidatus Thiodiazotropha sp. (ex Ctena orbiculata)]|nr:ATP-dependent RNA helicase HrpA [Candidatus Thiodiazotropha taylori]PUB88186.1 MAG: ATP-dependent RNA helicase HrpA [gamma proteobacterium symbiont of Ctena orbiculata]MBT2996984.1 ATP-dependent RNA helicase HrpA [Candidatus Thiodiazotropha taylori]MBT3000839.1 ATP-dependent RNA helicase HrpA [Candidatus Thiodiazotropha taylori]MBT3026976.1 ATP-dependent RNA helicase HrpA [Candidatus Thiodiazotropha taylori]
MLRDRHRLYQQLRGLRKREARGGDYSQGLLKLWHAIRASQQCLSQRRAQLPQISYPQALPISQRVDEIRAFIRSHQVVVLCGETGSGKSTQLPKICLDAGLGVAGYIGHTQPRRVAARTLATRVASELGSVTGQAVGYKVRFHDRVGTRSYIKLMTDGILLAEIQQDPYLNQYDALIIDESHERSLNIDFILGYLKRLTLKRTDLKLIITSATIDPQRFSAYFDNAPIIEVSGRTYPVELRYRPPAEPGESERDDPLQQAIVDAVDELSLIDRGDILIFLSGEREIRETAETLRKHRLPATEVLPLYARLSIEEQNRVFKAHTSRRIVLATNVAETSLTVPGIRYVIDTGYARISRYSHRSKVQRLPVERTSQASADQRKGRCGRISSGICIRLYAEEDFEARRPFTEPEIQRTNLASVILQMKLLGLGEINEFPFIDPPDHRLIKDGYRVLEEIGAVAGDRRVTRLGQQIARLPVDPRIGRMLLAAAHNHCLKEVMVIAAALSIQDPRERPVEKQQLADETHAKHRHDQSDFLAYLTLWDTVEEQRKHLSKNKFHRWCKQNFLSWNRVQEWHDIHGQLRGQLHEMGFRENGAEAGYEEIHRALLSGLLSHIGLKSKSHDYLGARNSRFFIYPGSGLYRKQPKWVMAAELVETSRLYARTLAAIQPEWVESAAGHLVKRNYSEPHWERKRGQVAAYEKITLYGVTLIPRRKINFSPVDAVVAREIFIRSALVDGDFQTRAPFWRHNQELIEAIHDMEAKSRRHDILVDEERIYAFYDQRIPEGISTTPGFEKWLRAQAGKQPKLLYMDESDLMRAESQRISREQFPDHLDINGMMLPLEYHFEPGTAKDGVTLVVPQDVLNQITDARLQWLVPGLLRERVISLLRGLPKSLRRSFVPVPDFADACLADLAPSDRSLVQVLGERLKQLSGVHIPEDVWMEGGIEEHLRMRLRVVDEDGATLEQGRDLAALKRRHANQPQAQHRHLNSPGFERSGLKAWDFESLPKRLGIVQGGIDLQGYPALVDEGESVAIRLLDAESNARLAHKGGVRRLLMLKIPKEVRYLRKNLIQLERMRLLYAKVPGSDRDQSSPARQDLEEELVSLIIDRTFLDQLPEIRDSHSFEERLQSRRGSLMEQANSSCKQLLEILELSHTTRKAISSITQVNWMSSVMDMQRQLDRLVYRGFMQLVPDERLNDYPRYLQGILKRVEKLSHAARRDQQRMAEMAELQQKWEQWEEQCRVNGRVDERIDEVRWGLEELRISLFAQELGTAYPVSVKRLLKRIREMGL